MSFLNYIQFPFEWHQPRYPRPSRLEMANKRRLVLQVKHGQKIVLYFSAYSLPSPCCFSFVKKSVFLYYSLFCMMPKGNYISLSGEWSIMALKEEKKMHKIIGNISSGIQKNQVWNSITSSHLQYLLETKPKGIKAIVDINRGFIKYWAQFFGPFGIIN